MNRILSDYNKPGYVPSVTQVVRYSDLDMTLRTNSVGDIKGDIIPHTDIDAIKNSVRNLILTNIYERPFEPLLGSRIRSLLFESVTPLTALSLKDEIENVIVENEPRISQFNVYVNDMADENAYYITVQFNVNDKTSPQLVEFIINRLR